ncbi:S-adenosyl-L-methionine-dependent methyltransferase [Gautieria morchelliformis]|nr:S-adenosyl-L-methionine-dependent methyltransferase [Gautieria morchelliformis]
MTSSLPSSVSPDGIIQAQQLLQLVTSISDPTSGLDPLSVWNAKIQIQHICGKIMQSTMGPLEYTVLLAESCQESQSLHFVTSLGIADFIGDGEATLATLSEKAGVLPQFLVSVTMSCVLGRGYFEEVGCFGSRVYKNNELSQILRETHPTSVKAAVGFIGDEGFRAASRLLDAAKVPSPGQKTLPASNQVWRSERLGKAMLQLHTSMNGHVSEDFPWHELNSPIVDVGGGIGSLEMSLVAHEKYSHLEFLIVDLPKTIAAGKNIWTARLPEMLKRVSFVPGNFMASTFEESNIPEGKPTYVIRHVLHDWKDDEVVFILSQVRQAMLSSKSSCRLLVVEMLLQPTSSRFVRTTSMQLLALNNGVTRTQQEIENLVCKAGFRVETVTHIRALDSVIEAVAI